MESDSELNGNTGRGLDEAFLPAMIATRLAALESGQSAMNGALGLMLDTLRTQTFLLRKLTEYASDEPAPSPVAKILGELAAAVMQMDDSVVDMAGKFEKLSDIIVTAFEIEVNKASPPAPNGKIT